MADNVSTADLPGYFDSLESKYDTKSFSWSVP